MTDMSADMTRDFRMANKAMQHFNAALLDFQAHCLRFDWSAAETARETAQASIDSFLDNMAAAYKRMESA